MNPSLEQLLQSNPSEAAKQIQRELAWWSKNKIKTFYPETGPLRRELYVKHMQFFEAGATHRTRAAIAGNRCITPWTPLETDRGERQAREMIGETGFGVRSWDGNSLCTKRASHLYLRSIEPSFQIHLDNGQAFQCSGRHRVLLSAESAARRPSDWVSISQIIRGLDGLRCERTSQGWKTSYAEGDHLYGEQLPRVLDIDERRPPKQFDAPSSDQYDWLVDEAASKSECNRVYQVHGHLSTRDGQRLLEDLCEKIEVPTASLFSLPSTLIRGIAQRFQDGLILDPEDILVELRRPLSMAPLVSLLLWALNSPTLFGARKIVAVIPLGYQPIIDMGVEETNNYLSAGVIHHNCGKTEGLGAYEVTIHTTGNYPPWWKGHRFKGPNNWWVAGDTNQTTRDILQAKLLGKIIREKGDDASKPAGLGTGLVPASVIKATRAKAGSIPNAVETVWIKHVSGGVSSIVFKSYEQGREAFQGTEQDGILLDEEPDEGIYNECLIRTMATGGFKGGIILLTFTPLSGWSDVVAKFLDPEECRKSHSFVIQMGWDDAPHLSEQAKAEMLAHLPPHQRDARAKGIPQLGSGAIYPIGESEISVNPFEIPPHWPRVYGMDVGWNRTAAIWGAWNRDADIVYLYEQHYFAHSEPGENARAIKGRGAWIPGVIDPASRGRSQVDGTQLIEQYQNLGLELSFAVNAVDSGIYDVWERMVSGRLKVFASLADFWKEFRVYRRDEKGRIVKKGDHLMDSTRYLVKSGLDVAKQKPVYKPTEQQFLNGRDFGSGWLG